MSDKKPWPKPQSFTIDKGHELLGDGFKPGDSIIWCHADEALALEAVAKAAKALRYDGQHLSGCEELHYAFEALDAGREGRA